MQSDFRQPAGEHAGLQFLARKSRVLVKGRVASSFSTSAEVIITRLLFRGAERPVPQGMIVISAWRQAPMTAIFIQTAAQSPRGCTTRPPAR